MVDGVKNHYKKTIMRQIRLMRQRKKWPLEIVSLNNAWAIRVMNGGSLSIYGVQKITDFFITYRTVMFPAIPSGKNTGTTDDKR